MADRAPQPKPERKVIKVIVYGDVTVSLTNLDILFLSELCIAWTLEDVE
jgi:hypothetical protein